MHRVPVDVGGAVNTLTTDRDIGAGDPFLHTQTNKSGGFAAGGNLCEVSKELPADGQPPHERNQSRLEERI